MNLRQKLLLLLSITVTIVVAAVAWTVLIRIRQVFEQRDQEETALFVAQFQREFQHRSAEVASAVERLAASERMRGVAYELAQSNDPAPYLNEAQSLAQDAQLDFLEIVGPDGNIVSSAQWPARFGYAEPSVNAGQNPFLKSEELPDGPAALGLFAVRAVRRSDAATTQAVRLIGGKRLDQRFLADLALAPGMQAGLYSDLPAGDANSPSGVKQSLTPFDTHRLIGTAGELPNAERYQTLIESARRSGQEANAILYLTSRRDDSVSATALPLKNEAGQVLAILVVTISRESMVQAQQHIRAIAYGVAAGGIFLAILVSLWIAARVSRPIEQLANAAEQVAAGNWDAHVDERGRDEIATLSRSFNHMTQQLTSQRERLVQSERVAAWRELARRLAHELKNPLFPLQLTVENLVRARDLSAAEFDEVFNESTHTLGMEIANLKTIIGRFSDFSKMPRPEIERVDARDIIERLRSLYATSGLQQANIRFDVQLSPEPMPLDVDPELLHRALSNLVLNAMDAMPEGGTLTIAARPHESKVEIRVADTGQGFNPEECERLFTPYYTTKQHGTGLGLAIAQSVIADPGGTLSVEGAAGKGATFVITPPKADGGPS